MSTPVDVRYRLTTDDAELSAAAELVYSSISGLDQAGVSGWFRSGYAGRPLTVFTVALAGSQVVGTLMSHPNNRLVKAGLPAAEVRSCSWLQYVAVASDRRGEGIGRQLVDHARAEVQAVGVRKWIGGAENPEAATFFARCGFDVLAPGEPMRLPGTAPIGSSRPGYRWFYQDW